MRQLCYLLAVWALLYFPHGHPPDVGALLVARKRGGANPGHGARSTREGELRVLGPVMQQHDFVRECRLVPVANLGRGKRAALERIVNGVGLRPDGWWNSQNWVAEVLKRAGEHDLIISEERDNAIYTAAEP